MLVNLKDILEDAKKEGYAVPATNIDNEHNLRAAISAAEEMNSPIILNVTPIANPDLEFFGPIAAELGRRSKQKVCLNLDHGKDFLGCLKGIRSGFTSIMIDRSLLSYEENVKQVSEMVRICHELGISVEAELGHVGMGDNYAVDGNNCLTNPDMAVKFVNDTGIDALAVAIGTAHGSYIGEPHIDFDLLHELSEKVSIPLVLHGGSGTGEENLVRCSKEGINKINLSNDLKKAAIKKLLDSNLEGNGAYQLYPLIAEGFKEKVQYYIRLLGSENK
ncbi:MAG: class II fructose-bisphosphate aldolase [Bacilli bacterium]